MKRVLLKLSGEALAGEKRRPDLTRRLLLKLSKQIRAISDEGRTDRHCDRRRKFLERTHQ